MIKTVFITGANRGVGLEFTRQFLTTDARVIASCRYPDKADALHSLQAEYPKMLSLLPLDMLNKSAIQQIGTLVAEPIDILILNAGISGQRDVTIGNINLANMQQVFTTNSFAPICLADALLSQVRESNEKLIIAISSKMGSIDDNRSGRSYAYRGSKAALNAMMFSMSVDVKAEGIKVLILHPGSVQTDMSGPNALIDVQTSVVGMYNIITNAANYASGTFIDYKEEIILW